MAMRKPIVDELAIVAHLSKSYDYQTLHRAVMA